MLIHIFALLSPLLSALGCCALGYRGLGFLWRFAVFGIALFLALCILFLLFAWLSTLRVDQSVPQTQVDPFFHWLMAQVAALILFFSGVIVRASGFEKLPKDRLYLLVGNHLSDFDPIALLWVLRREKIGFISKPENLRIPLIGDIIHKCCFLPIDREDDRKALTTILSACELMKSGACSICIYPEGTRNKSGVGLLPFKAGAFKIAQRTAAPVGVVATSGTERVHKRWPLPTVVHVQLADVIEQPEGKRVSTQLLSDQTRQILSKALHLSLPEQKDS